MRTKANIKHDTETIIRLFWAFLQRLLIDEAINYIGEVGYGLCSDNLERSDVVVGINGMHRGLPVSQLSDEYEVEVKFVES